MRLYTPVMSFMCLVLLCSMPSNVDCQISPKLVKLIELCLEKLNINGGILAKELQTKYNGLILDKYNAPTFPDRINALVIKKNSKALLKEVSEQIMSNLEVLLRTRIRMQINDVDVKSQASNKDRFIESISPMIDFLNRVSTLKSILIDMQEIVGFVLNSMIDANTSIYWTEIIDTKEGWKLVIDYTG